MADQPVKGTRLTGEARAELAAEFSRKYQSGDSIRELAVEAGRSYGFVRRLLVEQGVTLRGRGGAPKSRARKTA